MRGVLVCLSPSFPARCQGHAIEQTLGSDQPLKCREPMVIIMRAVVWLATISGSLQFISKGAGPFLPSKMSLLRKLDRERKRLCLPWLSEYRATGIARQSREGCKTFGLRKRI